jgi:hypothetical protein
VTRPELERTGRKLGVCGSMAGMKRAWPESKLAQAGIAFVIAAISSAIVFNSVETSRFKLYARLYPHDGRRIGSIDELASGRILDAFRGVWYRVPLATSPYAGQSQLKLKWQPRPPKRETSE